MQEYLVKYPTGKTFTVRGKFTLTPLGNWLVPAIFQEGNKAAVLDQRAIVEHLGTVVYSPRRHRDGLDPMMAEWLDDHPEWGA